jgi:Rrf2 family transcriptional regulator, cysteine metabolism repressor
MPILNRKVDYALLILCYLHHKSDGGCARAIASCFRLSRPFVANILKELCQKGFVLSQRGMKGGYLLCEETIHKSLADLIDALDTTLQLAECNSIQATECCNLTEECPIRGPIAEVHSQIRTLLEGVKLLDLFKQAPRENQPVELNLSRCESDAVPKC